MFTLLFLAFTAIGRVCLGTNAATSSRYVPYAIPGMLALCFGIQSAVLPLKSKALRVACISILVILCVAKETTVSRHRNHIEGTREAKRKWAHEYLKEKSVSESNGKANFKLYPIDGRIEEKIKFLEENNLSFFRDVAHRSKRK
jgi:hypothetical protein